MAEKSVGPGPALGRFNDTMVVMPILDTMVVMPILITSDRFWSCPQLAYCVLERLIIATPTSLTIVHGGATGVDEWFRTTAKGLGLTVEPHPVAEADWRRLGKRTGPLQNGKMVTAGADLCIAVYRFVFNSKARRTAPARPSATHTA